MFCCRQNSNALLQYSLMVMMYVIFVPCSLPVDKKYLRQLNVEGVQ